MKRHLKKAWWATESDRKGIKDENKKMTIRLTRVVVLGTIVSQLEQSSKIRIAL